MPTLHLARAGPLALDRLDIEAMCHASLRQPPAGLRRSNDDRCISKAVVRETANPHEVKKGEGKMEEKTEYSPIPH
jgi:hypothetical protein